MIIPVFSYSKESPKPSEEGMSSIFCQVKNWGRTWSGTEMLGSIEGTRDRVSKTFQISHPHMQLLLQVGDGGMGQMEEGRKRCFEERTSEAYIMLQSSMADMESWSREELARLKRIQETSNFAAALETHYVRFEELKKSAHVFQVMNNPTDYGHCGERGQEAIDIQARKQINKWTDEYEYQYQEEYVGMER